MKLFLTSAGLPPETTQDFLNLLARKPQEMQVCFVPTASYAEHPQGDAWYVQKDKERLLELGFKTITEIDLRNENRNSLEKKLGDCDLLFIEGGNTFYLLKYARESDFSKVLKNFLDRGGIYLGVSAGSMIAGLNIESAGWKHAEDKNIVKLEDLTGLGLVPFVISPHTDATNIEIVTGYAAKANYPIIALTDQQAILVDDGTQKVVGAGERYILNENKV